MLAHSARPQRRIPAQGYSEHIRGVFDRSKLFAEAVVEYGKCAPGFVDAVCNAALYHDLGKLDAQNQSVLHEGAGRLATNHVDAGVAALWQAKQTEAAMLVSAHHRGFPSIHEEASKKEPFLRDLEICQVIDKRLPQYLKTQHELLADRPVHGVPAQPPWSSLTRRLALSCLVDADHTDTAAHYGASHSYPMVEPRWADRLAALDRYVGDLAKHGGATERTSYRQDVYSACRDAPTQPAIWACDSPVGTGKTTAIMAHLLSVAAAQGKRRIIVVLPYTNIIKQSVEVYRKALVLPGEDPEAVVAEHHHQAEFSSPALRGMTTLWQAPITVTTAVQFFETLGSNTTARLRKLHALPGAAVFVDEMHAALPAWLWRQTWEWVRELAEDWSVHWVLASGSLPRFWRARDFVQEACDIPDLIPDELRERGRVYEGRRIEYRRIERPLDREALLARVTACDGPRIVIVNTVQTCAVLADDLRRQGKEVYHLSTALTPADREVLVERILTRLQDPSTDWTLIATSCVEAGMDFSFATAFRERSTVASLIQIGGRVNRHGERDHGVVWDFVIQDALCNYHPAFTTSRRVISDLFDEHKFEEASATSLVTEGMLREARLDPTDRDETIVTEENRLNYPEVERLCRVIDSDTRLVVVDPACIEAVEHGQPIPFRTLQRNSVQIWANKLDDMPVEPLDVDGELFKWTGLYEDVFLGYMASIVPMLRADQDRDVGVL